MTRNELIEENMKLVYFIINKYFPTYIGNEDVIQDGMIGLCRAADAYDPNKGAFSTIASKYIINEVRHGLRDKSLKCLSLDRLVADDIDSDLHEIVAKEIVNFDDGLEREKFYNTLSKRQREVYRGLERELTQAEIAKELGVTHSAVGQVARTIKRRWRRYNGEN